MSERRLWWKGDFPTWLVALLLGILGFFAKREMASNDAAHQRIVTSVQEAGLNIDNLKVRVALLEQMAAAQKELLNRIDTKLDTLTKRP